VDTSNQIGACLNKYFDYDVEKCFMEYEKNYTITYLKDGVNTTEMYIGFSGPG
jgi:hypothetical protein